MPARQGRRGKASQTPEQRRANPRTRERPERGDRVKKPRSVAGGGAGAGWGERGSKDARAAAAETLGGWRRGGGGEREAVRQAQPDEIGRAHV